MYADGDEQKWIEECERRLQQEETAEFEFVAVPSEELLWADPYGVTFHVRIISDIELFHPAKLIWEPPRFKSYDELDTEDFALPDYPDDMIPGYISQQDRKVLERLNTYPRLSQIKPRKSWWKFWR